MKVLWTICLAVLAHNCAGQGSNRREAVIQDWIRKIREAPKGHSMSPSWSTKSRIPVKFPYISGVGGVSKFHCTTVMVLPFLGSIS